MSKDTTITVPLKDLEDLIKKTFVEGFEVSNEDFNGSYQNDEDDGLLTIEELAEDCSSETIKELLKKTGD